MKSIKPAIMALLMVLALACGTVVHAGDDSDDQRVFVTVTSGEAQTRGMALVLANQMAGQGAEVRVLLCGPGGELALADHQPPKLKPRDVTPVQLLSGLIDQGATVEVCAIFLPNTGYEESDLADGIGVARPDDVAEWMLQPGVRWFSH